MTRLECAIQFLWQQASQYHAINFHTANMGTQHKNNLTSHYKLCICYRKKIRVQWNIREITSNIEISANTVDWLWLSTSENCIRSLYNLKYPIQWNQKHHKKFQMAKLYFFSQFFYCTSWSFIYKKNFLFIFNKNSFCICWVVVFAWFEVYC